jgi:hypothetical protein
LSSYLPKITQIVVFSLVLLASGCAQRDSGVGLNALTGIPDQDFITISGTATASAQWIPDLSNGRGNSLQIGNVKSFTAMSAMRWQPIEALPDSYLIDHVEFHFSTARIWPDNPDILPPVPDLRVVIREITEDWDETELTPGALADYENFPVIDSILIESVADDSFSYELPEEIWRKWIAEEIADLEDDSVSTITSFGLLFQPINEGVMVELRSSEGGASSNDESSFTAPVMRIYGTQWALEDTIWTSSDMLELQKAVHDGYLTMDSSVTAPGHFRVCSGYPQRALLYFPLDTLEAYTDRIITRAELRIFGDSTDQDNFYYNQSTLGFQNGVGFRSGSIKTNDWVSSPDSIETLELRYIGTENSYFIGDRVDIEVSGIVAGWIANPGTNGGLQLQSGGESQYLTRISFYNHETTDSTKLPQLVIWYAKPSN